MDKKLVINLRIAGLVIITAAALWYSGSFQGLENKSLDFRFLLRGAAPVPSSIAIVSADEKSISRLGRWPWQRSVHGELVKKLTAAGARVIAFDVLFTEPDIDRPRSDKSFGDANRASGRVVLGSFFSQVNSEGNPDQLLAPIPVIAGGSGTGFVNYYPELDGLNRHFRPVMAYQDAIVPSLGMAAVAAYLGEEPLAILEKKGIPLNEYGEALINYYGGYESFPYYSYSDVLEDAFPAGAFKDRIVLVGGTATALFDVKAVTFSQIFPGVEIHANSIANILENNFLGRWQWQTIVLLIVLFALIPAFMTASFSPLLSGGIVAVVGILYSLGVFALFKWQHTHAEFVAPIFSLAVSYVGILFYNFVKEEKEKRWIKKTFSHYLSAQVMESILADPNRLKLGGQRETLTILFSDIRGFTSISEALKPEEVVELLNEYLSKMVEIVFKYNGTLDKFIGDAVMAFWGAPVAQNDHAKRAVLCAVEMMEELAKLQEKWRSEGKKIIDIGIGVNTGEMVVGNMGSKDKMEYTVIGDNVNLGSRLEGLNKDYKTHIIISDSTFQTVKDIVHTRPLGAVKVKGKEIPVEIYEVTGRK